VRITVTAHHIDGHGGVGQSDKVIHLDFNQ
jgi:hypothetical protein